MSNRTYDILKYIALIVLPAVGTLYAALSQIWGFPYGEQIVATIVAIDAFLGAILKISSDNYYATMEQSDELNSRGPGEDLDDDEWIYIEEDEIEADNE